METTDFFAAPTKPTNLMGRVPGLGAPQKTARGHFLQGAEIGAEPVAVVVGIPANCPESQTSTNLPPEGPSLATAGHGWHTWIFRSPICFCFFVGRCIFREGHHIFAWTQFSCVELAEAFFPDTKAFIGDTQAFFAEPCSRQVSQGRFLKENVCFFLMETTKIYAVTARS